MANPADLYKSALRRSFTRLVEDLDPQPILDRFIEKGFLPYTVIRDIQETRRTSDKNRAIIEKVMSKGPDGYKTFKKCLNDTHQGHLADHLNGAENKIKQEESKKPRAATRVGGQTGPKARSPYPVVATQPVSHQYSNQPLPRYQQPVRPKSTYAQPIQPIQTKGQPTQHIQTEGQPIQHIPMEGRPTQPIPTREHQYPIYTEMRETEFLSEKRLLALSKDLGTEWYSLAINLNLTNASIQQIMSNYPNNTTLQIVTILVRWRNNNNTQNPFDMMQELAAALEEVGRRDLAQKVKQQYQDWLGKGKEKLRSKEIPKFSKGDLPSDMVDIDRTKKPSVSIESMSNPETEIINQGNKGFKSKFTPPSSNRDMQLNTMVSDTEPLSYAASMTDLSKRKRDSDQSYTNTEENIVTPDNQPASSNAALGKTCIQDPSSSLAQHGQVDFSRLASTNYGEQLSASIQDAPSTSSHGQHLASGQDQQTRRNRGQSLTSGHGQQTINSQDQPPVINQNQHTAYDSTSMVSNIVQETDPSPVQQLSQLTLTDDNSQSHNHGTGPGQLATSGQSQVQANPYGHGQPTMSNPNLESAQSHNTASNYTTNNNTQMTAQPSQHPGMSIDLDNPDHDSVDAVRLNYSGIQTGTENVPEIQTTTEPMHQAIHNIETELEKIKVMNSHRNPTDLPPTVPLVNDNAAQPTEVDAFVKKTETTTGVNTSSLASTVTVLDSEKIPGITRSIDVNVCPHDGRIWQLDLEDVKTNLKKKLTFNSGGYGTIYRGKSSNLDMQVVFKKIEYKGAPDKRKSAINEMVAGRVMHYAIVPLLGMAEDLQEEVLYFMLPYLEKYDLMSAIAKDEDNVKKRKPAELTAEERLKILYQIAAAMQFLHCPVEGLRGPIIHRDITTRNIVLDKDGNARLLDFGLSREFEEGQTRKTMTQSDMIGTPGYFMSSRMSDLNEKTDCLNFGVVILELLTGAKPVEGKNKQLCKTKLIHVKTNIKDYPIRNKGHITGVWGDDWLYVKELIQLAKKCLEQNITTSELFDTIKGLLSTGPFWTPSENISKCVICMVNPAAGRDVLNHSLSCNLHVCVACMRNSYLNPIHCHTCGNEVEPPIGKKWGALLIAGNDTKMKECADIFSNEMLDAHDTFVSKHPLVMGIRKEHAYCIKPTKPGEPDTLKSKLQDSINELYEKGQHKTLDTLVFYFNGHCEDKGFLLGSDDEFITKEDLEKDLFQRLAGVGYTRFIVFLDCCTASGFAVPELSKGNCIIQMNASRYLDITRVVDGFGSPFTQFLIAGLKGKALDKPCSSLRGLDIGGPLLDCKICEEYTMYHSDSLISVDKLFNFIQKHTTAMGIHNLPTHFIANGNNKNTKIAYFIDTPVKVTFELQPYENSDQERTRRFELANLPKQFSELTQILLRQYKEKYHLSEGIDEVQHSDIISVSINTGPKEADVQELDTLEKVVVAWNGKQKLFVGLREIDNINKGKVGIILNGETRSDYMLEMYLKKMGNCQIEKIKGEEIVRVRTEKLENLHSDLCNFQSSDQASSVHLDYLKEHILCKLLTDEGIELQDSNKCLLMRFPEKMVNFLVLELVDVVATSQC